MGRILSIDYGKKRTGLAWTDPFQIIATGIGSIDTPKLKEELINRVKEGEVEEIVLGFPTRLDGSDTHATQAVKDFQKWLVKRWPEMKIHLWDERFTSKMAHQTMLDAGLSRKKRKDKHLVNQISATIILQEFLSVR